MKLIFSSALGFVALFLLFFGCLFMTIGGGVYYFTIYSFRDWVAVPGVVTNFQSSTSTDSDGFTSTTYCPWVEYTTTSGESYEVLVNECSSPRAFDAGETVTVLYDPAAPDQAQLRGSVREVIGNILGIGFGLFGCIPTGLAIVLIIVAVVNAARKSRPSAAALSP
jgi:hypothetical protein